MRTNKRFFSVILSLAMVTSILAAFPPISAKASDMGLITFNTANANGILDDSEVTTQLTAKGIAWNNAVDTYQAAFDSSVTGIADSAFAGQGGRLTAVDINSGIQTIGEQAFASCEYLSTLTISDGVTSIGPYAFTECTSLTSLSLPNTITKIEEATFYNCSGLMSIDIPNSILEIGADAFGECSAIASITIPSSVTVIGDRAFGWCDDLTELLLFCDAPTTGANIFTFSNLITEVHVRSDATGYAAMWAGLNVIADIYKYTFDAAGGTGGTNFYQLGGTLLNAPTVSRTGYSFGGWQDSGTDVTFPTLAPGADTTYTAVWNSTNNPSKPSNSGGGSSSSGTPSYKIINLKDASGKVLKKFDTTSVLTSSGIMQLVYDQDENCYIWSVNLERMRELGSSNKGGILRLVAGCITYDLPFDITNIIDGLADYIRENELSAKDLTLELKVRKLEGAELEKAKAAYAKAFPDGELVSDFYEISFTIYDKDGKELNINANQFIQPLTFTMSTTQKGNSMLIFNAAANNFSFVPAKFNNGGAMASTRHNSIYFTAENDVTFTDVQQDAWYAPFVTEAANKALVSGMGGNFYQPDRAITRAEFVQMISNALQLTTIDEDTVPYDDVSTSAWYYNAVMQAKSAGLLDKFAEDNFSPDKVISREEMAVILAAVLKANNRGIFDGGSSFSLSGLFEDSDEITAEYAEDIILVYRSKLMLGVGGGKFDPKGAVTRAQAATVQINLLKLFNTID